MGKVAVNFEDSQTSYGNEDGGGYGGGYGYGYGYGGVDGDGDGSRPAYVVEMDDYAGGGWGGEAGLAR